MLLDDCLMICKYVRPFLCFHTIRRSIHPEHAWAQEALLNIRDVIHLKKTKRFLDEAMPSLMEAIRQSRPDAALPHAQMAKLRSRKIEKRNAELLTPLLADGHVVSICWEKIARNTAERKAFEMR